MDRREHVKLLLSGSLGGGLLSLFACAPDELAQQQAAINAAAGGGYGRTAEEIAHDAKINAETFYTPHEMATIAVLSDIIIPKDEVSGSATDAKVPDFIEFITKDSPSLQTPMRGGLAWLDLESRRRFNADFVDVTSAQQLEIVEDIAWADQKEPALQPGVRFFHRMRGLVCTGFYTTRMGVDDLGYVGNVPNTWDGVPAEVLAKHGFSYDDAWKDRYLKPSDRERIVTWDTNGNPT